MSITNLLKSVCVISIGAVSGYTIMKYSQQPLPQNRSMASVITAKVGKEQMARQYFDIMTDQTKISKSESDVSEIKISFKAIRNLNEGLSYQWNLPSGVNLIEGPLQGAIQSLNAGEALVFTIKVNGFSKELKKYLSFEINGAANQMPIRQEVLISSRIEDSLEYLVQQSEKKNQQNGVNKLNKKSKFSPENVVK